MRVNTHYIPRGQRYLHTSFTGHTAIIGVVYRDSDLVRPIT